MILTKTKLNVLIGVLTGALVGFVLGAAFGTSSAGLSADKDNGAGNISKVAAFGKFLPQTLNLEDSEVQGLSDTIRFVAKDEEGKDMEILIVNK